MGNKTVTPEKSRAPVYPASDGDPYTSVNALYTDFPLAPRRSATPPVSYNYPAYTFPVNSRNENPYNYHPMPTTSPTFAFPVHSPANAIPMGSPSAPAPIESPSLVIPIESPTTGIRIESPVATIPLEHPVASYPIESSTSVVPVKSPTPVSQKVPSITGVPLNSPTPRAYVSSPVVLSSAAVPTNSPIAKVPVSPPIPVVSAVSPSSKVPVPSTIAPTPLVSSHVSVPVPSPIAAPVASSSPDIPPIPSPIPNVNGFPVASPDTSAVSPTLDLNTTPVTSPVPPKPVAPVKPIIPINKKRVVTRITHDAATSPMVRVVTHPRRIPRTSRAALPSTSRAIPPTSRVIPPTSRAVPPSFRVIPSTTRSVPPNSRSVPSTTRSIPPTTRIMPSTYRDMPPTTRIMPSTSRDIPPTHHDMPPTTRIMPSTYRDMPPTTRAMPSTSRDIPPTFHDILSPSPDIPPTSPDMPPTYRPSEAVPIRPILKNPIQPPVSILKQPASKTPTQPPVSVFKQTKHSTLSSPDRSAKWYEFEQKQQEEQKRLAETVRPIENPSKSPVFSPMISSPDVEITPTVPTPPTLPDITAVPSFSLRSTAVSYPNQDHHLLSERTQSIHNDFSICKYYLTYNEAKHAIGDHTKATMFQMNTQLKKTPLPAPSFSFLTKNFNDGTQEIKYHSDSSPAFGALGIQHELENESLDQFPDEPRSHEKQKQRTVGHSSWRPNDTIDSNNSLQFVQSATMSQVDFQGLEQNGAANNRQPLASILKKPSAQFNINPLPSKPNNIIFQEFQNIDSETNNNNNLAGVSFKLPLSPSGTKANQSISRSVRLTHRNRMPIDNM